MTEYEAPQRTAEATAKDHASMAVVLTGAAIAWFGWGHQGLRIAGWLEAGMLASAIALVLAILLVRRIRAAPTLATDPRSRRVYWTAVIAEILCIVAGALVLGALGLGAYLSTWTLFVVGVHFLPFVKAFDAPFLRLTAAACVLVAALALWAGLSGAAPAPTIAGAGGGVVLLVSALAILARTARARRNASPTAPHTA